MADFAHLDRLLNDFTKNGLPGCGCAVAKDGRILYEGYHGYADIEAGKLIGPDTVYRLYSMTKVIICTAAMMLCERGKFLLSDPLYEYIPEYRRRSVVHTKPNGSVEIREAKEPVLIKHAFSMAVGMPHPRGETPTAQAMAEIRRKLNEQYGEGKFDIVSDVKAMLWSVRAVTKCLTFTGGLFIKWFVAINTF
jgi:CubicO group peptidase (beta-lactamase class C family)